MNKGYFSKKVVEWYQEHSRDLPWRNTQDAYKIWLSEIILQQTRVAQGLPYYERFIQHYPNIKSLAEAKEQEVLRLWQGLGYYSRARNLHKCAREVVRKFKGEFPETFQELRQLPGIGDYTAAAIASFAFGVPVAVVDGNVYRVLARIFGMDHNTASPSGRKYFFDLANQLLAVDQPGAHNQAMMEFGALHCLTHNPKCNECIFSSSCFANQHAMQDLLPVKTRLQRITKRYFCYFLLRRGKQILMTERIEKDIWKGLFDLPLLEETNPVSAETSLKKIFPRASFSIGTKKKITISKAYTHILTHQRILARFVEMDWPAGKKLPSALHFSKAKWYSSRQIDKIPKPVLITRYLEDCGVL